MPEFTIVHFDWSNGQQTTENFLKEREVYKYLETLLEEDQIQCSSMTSNNPKWEF